VVLAKERYGLRGATWLRTRPTCAFHGSNQNVGVNLDGRRFAKALRMQSPKYISVVSGNGLPKEVQATVEQIARSGGTPLVVSENRKAWRDLSQRHRQGRHSRAFQPTAFHGHSHRHESPAIIR